MAVLASCTPSDAQVSELVAQFRNEAVFWKQVEIGEDIAKLGDRRALLPLESWLTHEDRHVRGNVAFVFAKLGDSRGLSTLVEMLHDHSEQRRIEMGSGSFIFPHNAGQTLTVEEMEEAYRKSPAGLRAQIRTDRYYAVHLLGRLGDSMSVDALVPLLSDEDVNYNVAWALGEIGDPRAVAPLIVALQNPDALVRVSAINALEKMHAHEALPHLRSLFEDTSLPSAGDRVPVGTAARTTFYKLQYEASRQ